MSQRMARVVLTDSFMMMCMLLLRMRPVVVTLTAPLDYWSVGEVFNEFG
jgi:hypothetical protein